MKCSIFRSVVICTGLAAFFTILSSFRIFQAQEPDRGPVVHLQVDAEDDDVNGRQREVVDAVDDHVDEPHGKETWLMLLAFQRSGTHWLTQELSRHPCIYVAGEILLAPGLKEDWWSPQKRRAGIKRFYNVSLSEEEEGLELPEVLQEWASENRKALEKGKFIRGFNWKVSQGFLQDLPWIEEFIASRHVRVIWLERKNMLRRYLSMMSNRRFLVAATTDKSKASQIKKEKVPIPVEKMLKDLKAREAEVKELQKFFKQLGATGHEVLQVVYEDLSASMNDIRRWVLRETGCGVSAENTVEDEPGYQKLHPGNLSDMVENWKEVASALKKTKWEWMLNS